MMFVNMTFSLYDMAFFKLLLFKELTFIFYLLSLQLALCCVAALKAAPYIVLSAVYIFLLVLGDQRKYSEKSEICICLDPCFLNRFSLFGPHLD